MALSSSVTLRPRARFRMFAAMGEAMLNVQYHAYDPAFPRSTPVLDGRWWMAGFHDDQKQAVWAFFVDQGATIPATLPRRWQGGLMKVLARSEEPTSELQSL